MLRIFALITWALFAYASLLFRHDHVFVISQTIDVLAFLGLIAAMLSFVVPSAWRRIAIASSSVLAIAYIIRWVFLTQYVSSGDANITLSEASGRVIHLWSAEFGAHWKMEEYFLAFLSIYWNVVMPLVQLALIAILCVAARKAFSGNSQT